jgi:predicted nucleotidyltransferase
VTGPLDVPREEPTRTQIETVVNGVRDILGDELVGMYLHGSGALDGFRPDSDIDMLGVSQRLTSDDEKTRLIELMLSYSGRRASVRSGRPIEFDMVVHSEIRPWRYPPRFDFHYDELLRDRFGRGELEPWDGPTNVDLASAITMVLLGDVTLVGPSPSQVFDPVPRSDYLAAIKRDTGTVEEYLPWDTRNVVLTLPRIWGALATDEVMSKAGASRWALVKLPDVHRPILELALAAYLGGVEDHWEDRMAPARAYCEHVVAQIERAVAQSGAPR